MIDFSVLHMLETCHCESMLAVTTVSSCWLHHSLLPSLKRCSVAGALQRKGDHLFPDMCLCGLLLRGLITAGPDGYSTTACTAWEDETASQGSHHDSLLHRHSR